MFKLNAEVRQAHGKGASRRLRHAGKIPAIIYGGNQEPIAIVLDHDEVINTQEKPDFYTSVITLVVDGKDVAVKTQAVQRHPFKPKMLHMDFVRA